MHDLGTLPGYANSIATGINSAGWIVGYCYNSETSGTVAFLYRNGAMINLNSISPSSSPWTITSATGINDQNQITGNVRLSDGRQRAYLLDILH